ncbi:hypothetical protein [Fluviispira sanaruensis]|uniref:Uncharacterized protein n=1 Tax=Fluviispira sanaruensis TaxID=2493639 RepID=A0A4P2VVX8_FLUSA|nr:hypothetical protein [Fluviispira sanaruensis]BBH53092.1 hypothetical protein JCM31447_15350 [Fluviispira sanaruensis]
MPQECIICNTLCDVSPGHEITYPNESQPSVEILYIEYNCSSCGNYAIEKHNYFNKYFNGLTDADKVKLIKDIKNKNSLNQIPRFFFDIKSNKSKSYFPIPINKRKESILPVDLNSFEF